MHFAFQPKTTIPEFISWILQLNNSQYAATSTEFQILFQIFDDEVKNRVQHNLTHSESALRDGLRIEQTNEWNKTKQNKNEIRALGKYIEQRLLWNWEQIYENDKIGNNERWALSISISIS